MWIQRSWSCVELLAFLSTVQIAAGPSYALAVALDGSLYTFGSGSNFCLGHGEQLNEFHPRAILSFKRKGIHLLRVSAGDEHVVALDSNGYVYTWGKGYCGALGHGNETDKTTPEPGEKVTVVHLGMGMRLIRLPQNLWTALRVTLPSRFVQVRERLL
ncbi:unnamed protein product [Cuscuta europaea]|uniref:Uncharacterized protein n=1 Tax=Cuscuta europaea TaxID=41803 RepID=A0A9P0ZG37_CUSEU|nr:unnamed protein product [Cuscuta europaea]